MRSPALLALHTLARARLLAAADAPGGAVDSTRTQWKTDMVVVVASYNEYNVSSLPKWMTSDPEVTFYVY